jgi:hypothetical protein
MLDVYCILYFPHLLGGFLHICALYMYYICGLWPPHNASSSFLTWYQSARLASPRTLQLRARSADNRSGSTSVLFLCSIFFARDLPRPPSLGPPSPDICINLAAVASPRLARRRPAVVRPAWFADARHLHQCGPARRRLESIGSVPICSDAVRLFLDLIGWLLIFPDAA